MVCRRITPISNAALRSLWLDPALTMATMAEKAGCSYDTISLRAKALGLPSRFAIRNTRRFDRGPVLAAMWRVGVSAHEMGRYFGVDQSSISRAAAEMGLPARGAGAAARMGLADFLETLLAARMAAARKAEIASVGGVRVAPVPVDLAALFPVPDAQALSWQAWRALFDRGLTARAAAARRGLTVKAAQKWAAGCGLVWPGSMPREQRQAQTADAWAALHAAGLTAVAAAQQRGLTADGARAWARKRGLRWADAAQVAA